MNSGFLVAYFLARASISLRAEAFLISWSIQPRVVAVSGPAFIKLYFGVSVGGASKTF